MCKQRIDTVCLKLLKIVEKAIYDSGLSCLMKWFCKKQKIIRLILLVAYIAFILWITIFSREVGDYRIFKPLFWELQVHYWKDTVKNILFFIPLGFLIGGKRGIIIGLCLTVLVEYSQYIFVLGYCELDDIMNNFIGTVVGVGIEKLVRMIISRCQTVH